MLADGIKKKGDVLITAGAMGEQAIDDGADGVGIEGTKAGEILTHAPLVEGSSIEALAELIDKGVVEVGATSHVSCGEGVWLRLDEGETSALGGEMGEPVDGGGCRRRGR